MNQYLQHCADKAMTSNRNAIMHQQINMPSLGNGVKYEKLNYQMEGLTLDNFVGEAAKYEELKYNLEGSTEEVVIPEDIPQVNAEQEQVKQVYYTQMSNMY